MSLKVPNLTNNMQAEEHGTVFENAAKEDHTNVNKTIAGGSSKINNNSVANFLVNNNINYETSTWQQKQAKNIQNRTRAMMYAPSQEKNYGPKATLKQVGEDYMQLVQDPLSQHLSWTKPPLYILVIKKLCNNLFDSFIDIIKYLIYNHHLIVYVEESQYDHEIFKADDQIKSAMKNGPNNEKPSLRKFSKTTTLSPKSSDDRHKIDLIICLGGDGTLLHASTLFQKSCPPVLSIHMGSLGFLCPFDFDNYRNYVNGVLKGGVPLLLRNRLKCKMERSLDNSDKSDDSNPNSSIVHVFNSSRFIDSSYLNEDDIMLGDQDEWLSLNEIVISRGPSPFLSNLDLYLNDYLITTVQGDGLIISTPTGSTAYAMAAGASMSHPSIPAIIIAPICPHSLSFRPITVPAGVELKIALSSETRNTAWYSVDGRNTSELKHGFHLSIKTSEYPLPSVCRSDQINDWFEGLATCLHWNQRQKQLPINSCYIQSRSLTPSVSHSQLHSSFSSSSSTSSILNKNNIAKLNGITANNNNLNVNINIPFANSSATIHNSNFNSRSNSNDSSDLENQIEGLNNDLESTSIDLDINYNNNNNNKKSTNKSNSLDAVKFQIDEN